MFTIAIKRNRRVRSAGFVATLCAASLLTLAGTSQATPTLTSTRPDASGAIQTTPEALQEPLERIYENAGKFKDSYKRVEGKEKTQLVQQAHASLRDPSVKSFLPEGASFAGAEASTYKSQSDSLVHVPISGSGLVKPSGIALIFDQNGSLTHYVQQNFSQLNKESGRVTVWSDGVRSLDKIAHSDGTLTEPSSSLELQPGAPTLASFSVFLTELNNCLSSAGIASWLVAAVSAGCAIACIGTAGAGCLACVYAVAGGTGGTIGWCIGVAAAKTASHVDLMIFRS